jgi:hypothetical protein
MAVREFNGEEQETIATPLSLISIPSSSEATYVLRQCARFLVALGL